MEGHEIRDREAHSEDEDGEDSEHGHKDGGCD